MRVDTVSVFCGTMDRTRFRVYDMAVCSRLMTKQGPKTSSKVDIYLTEWLHPGAPLKCEILRYAFTTYCRLIW